MKQVYFACHERGEIEGQFRSPIEEDYSAFQCTVVPQLTDQVQ